MEDETIIELYWNRSEEAIRRTGEKYGGLCRTIARNILRNEEDTEECVSDAYLSVWNAIPPARPNDFKAFLGRIVRNGALERYRHSHRQKRGGGAVTLVLSELEECVAGDFRTDDVIDREHIRALLNSFLEKLSVTSRIIFVRRYWFADSIEDIAALCGISRSRVKSSLYRSRQKLKKILEEGDVYV